MGVPSLSFVARRSFVRPSRRRHRRGPTAGTLASRPPRRWWLPSVRQGRCRLADPLERRRSTHQSASTPTAHGIRASGACARSACACGAGHGAPPQSPAMVISSIRIEPVRMPPRTSMSEPTSTICWYMSFRLPAIVTSCTGYCDAAVLDPEAGRAARVVAGHAVDALPHQFRDVQAAAHLPQHGVEAALPRPVHQQVVRAARIAGRAQAELARGVGAEHVAEQHAAVDEFAVARGHAFMVERRAGQRLRAGADARTARTSRETPAGPPPRAGTTTRRYWLPPRIAPMKCPIRPRATSGEYSTGAFVVASLRAPRRRNGALARAAADARRRFQLAPVAQRAVPVVALHLLAFAAEHRAADAVHGAGIGGEEAQRVAVGAHAAMRADRRALGIGDALRDRPPSPPPRTRSPSRRRAPA